MSRSLLLLSMLSIACGGDSAAPPGAAPRGVAAPDPGGASAAAGSAAEATRIVILGDSLAAGYGLAEDEAFPALLEGELRDRGWRVDVVNAGVSGDTTAGGRARLSWLLRQRPEILVLELGANDALRGLPIDAAEENLAEIIRRAGEAEAEVLLAGMRAPPNYGAEYGSAFAAIYPRLASQLDVALMPFLLEGVGGRPELNLADGIHPNAEGHRRIAAALLPHLETLLTKLDRAGARTAGAGRSGA